MITTKAIERPEEAEQLRARWDGLAVAASRPFCAPGWLLPWWRHAAPDGAAMRVIAVSDGDDLIGLAPLWSAGGDRSRGAYEAMTVRLSPPVRPLAAPGREAEAAEALAEALAEARPRPSFLRLEDELEAQGTLDRMIEAWPGRRSPWVHVSPPMPLPIVLLDELDYDGWLATKSSKFRQETRRQRRRLDDAGGEIRLVEADGVERAVEAFIELHDARWQGRGGSDALIPGIGPMLCEAARELPSGRLRIYAIEAEGRIVAVNLLVAAGEKLCGWNSGFDAAWGRYSPSLQLTLQAIADATESGERQVSLGPGGGAYKQRLADTQAETGIVTLVPHGGGYLRTRIGMLGYQARWGLSQRLSADAKGRLRRLVRR